MPYCGKDVHRFRSPIHTPRPYCRPSRGVYDMRPYVSLSPVSWFQLPLSRPLSPRPSGRLLNVAMLQSPACRYWQAKGLKASLRDEERYLLGTIGVCKAHDALGTGPGVRTCGTVDRLADGSTGTRGRPRVCIYNVGSGHDCHGHLGPQSSAALGAGTVRRMGQRFNSSMGKRNTVSHVNGKNRHCRTRRNLCTVPVVSCHDLTCARAKPTMTRKSTRYCLNLV